MENIGFFDPAVQSRTSVPGGSSMKPLASVSFIPAKYQTRSSLRTNQRRFHVLIDPPCFFPQTLNCAGWSDWTLT